jgi:hypothetical protein
MKKYFFVIILFFPSILFAQNFALENPLFNNLKRHTDDTTKYSCSFTAQSQNILKADGNRLSIALRYKPGSKHSIFKNTDAGIFIDGFINRPNPGYKAHYARDSVVFDTTYGFPYPDFKGFIYSTDSSEKWNNARDALVIGFPVHQTFYIKNGFIDIGFQPQYMFFSEIPVSKRDHFNFDLNITIKYAFAEMILKYKNKNYELINNRNIFSLFRPYREINLGTTNNAPSMLTHLPVNTKKNNYFSYDPDYYDRYFKTELLLHLLSKKERHLDFYSGLEFENMTWHSKKEKNFYNHFDPYIVNCTLGIIYSYKKFLFNAESNFWDEGVIVGLLAKYKLNKKWNFSIQLPSLLTIDSWYSEINHVAFGADYRF